MKWAPQQDQALVAVNTWLRDPRGKQTFYLAGYAGTGKTTLAKHLAESAGRVCFAAFTGKAALVLRSKGCVGAKTIHSMIYKLKDPESPVPEFVLDRDGDVKDADLVIIDEVSMVGEDLGRDLLSFGKKVLVLGDPGQLPPVSGEGFFTKNTPDFMLTEVHRQAADNPIIAMTMAVREGKSLSRGTYGDSRVIGTGDIDSADVLAADQILVGKNATRRRYNARLRQLLGRQGIFEKGERIVCLRNKAQVGLLNGGIWQVDKIKKSGPDFSKLIVSPLDAGMVNIPVEVTTHHAWLNGTERDLPWREQREYDPFDYAYALTCHKAQGSQWDHVMVFDESAAFRDDAGRWLYTALSRAAERVEIVQ